MHSYPETCGAFEKPYRVEPYWNMGYGQHGNASTLVRDGMGAEGGHL